MANQGVCGEMRYAIIDGMPIQLPSDSKYVVQDKRGVWFHAARKPRIKEGDWTPKKQPIQITTAQGFSRVLVTEPADNWEETLQLIMTQNNMPASHTQAHYGNSFVN